MESGRRMATMNRAETGMVKDCDVSCTDHSLACMRKVCVSRSAVLQILKPSSMQSVGSNLMYINDHLGCTFSMLGNTISNKSVLSLIKLN